MSQSGFAKQVLYFPGSGSSGGTVDGEILAERLVKEILAGDQASFDRLYRKYAPMVHAIVLSKAPRRDTDDLVQEIFLSVFRKLDTLRDPRAIGGWIASIARRSVADHFRASQASEELTDEVGSEDPRFGEAFEVLSAIRDLPDAYSETLMMRLVEGLTGPEIAEMTGLTHDSVRVNLHRGMKMLRRKLDVGS